MKIGMSGFVPGLLSSEVWRSLLAFLSHYVALITEFHCSSHLCLVLQSQHTVISVSWAKATSSPTVCAHTETCRETCEAPEPTETPRVQLHGPRAPHWPLPTTNPELAALQPHVGRGCIRTFSQMLAGAVILGNQEPWNSVSAQSVSHAALEFWCRTGKSGLQRLPVPPSSAPHPFHSSPEMARDLHYFFLLTDFPCFINSSHPRWHAIPAICGVGMENVTRNLSEEWSLSHIFKMYCV